MFNGVDARTQSQIKFLHVWWVELCRVSFKVASKKNIRTTKFLTSTVRSWGLWLKPRQLLQGNEETASPI